MGVPTSGSSTWMGISLRTLFLGIVTVQFSTFILLLHYSRVMPAPDGHRYLPSTAVFLVELLKLAVCLTLALYEVSKTAPRSTTAASLFSILGSAMFSGDSWQMAVPAFLYTLANSLQYVGIANLGPTYQVVYQLKIIVTAIFSVSLLKRSFSGRQWASLILLMVGVAIVSIPNADIDPLASNHHTRIYMPRSLESTRTELGFLSQEPKLLKRSATYEGIEEDELALSQMGLHSTSAGLLAGVGVCVCSGFAGVYFEKVVKNAPKTTSLWIRNVQLSVYSLFPAFFIGVLFIDGETVAKNGFFDGYNWVVVLSVLVQTFGAIIAAFCIFYADNVSKNFAVSISMVLSSLASFFFFDFEASENFLIGTSIVLFATYLYSMQEHARTTRPPPIRIHSYENITIDKSPEEAQEMSKMLPKAPMKAEEGLTTSRPGSPNSRHKRMADLGYFTKSHG